MKTIGEMLVETTARLVAAPDDSNASYVASVKSVDYPDQARAIVAEFYGPPCSGPTTWVDAVTYPGIPDCYEITKGDPARPGDICMTCGWPRGEHGR